MIDLSHLNEPQREAVLHEQGPLVVFAGAGSGKTRVIVHRVAHLITERSVPAYRIMAVTFTNKAAGEMKERLEHLVPGAARDLWVGTFHATCAKLLRRYHDRVGLARDFAIYDDGDQKAMLTRVIRDLKWDEKRFPPKIAASILDRSKNEMRGPEEAEVAGIDADRWRHIYAEYEKRMRAANALDFGDLIYRTVRALEADEALANELRGRFWHLLVDEFQDTNHAQFRLVRALTGPAKNVCVVGDDDQSIYRWRGADRRNILDFRRYYPDAQVIKLEQNYRSTKRILRVAHAVIAKNIDREPKQLWTDNDEGQRISVVRVGTEREEAELVVAAARELGREGKPLSDLAVFYRIHAQSRVLEEALRAANIPYRVVGGIRFYDRAEVKDLLAYLRILTNPEDDVSVLRVINVPTRGIGKTTIDKLLDSAAATGTGVMAAARAIGAEKGGAKVAEFVRIVDSLSERAKQEGAGVAELARAVLDETGYERVLKDENSAEADARLENLAELVGSMQAFEDEAEEPTLTAFLELVTLQTSADTVPGTEGEAQGSREQVTLMTVHAAKGLEFPVVLVCGMEEQLFPFRGYGEDEEDPEAEMEEERRLAYVAFTRARQKLVLSHATSRYVFGQPRICTRSRFLDELPRDDLQIIGDRNSTPSYRPHAAPPPGARRETWSQPARSSEERPASRLGVPLAGSSASDTWVDRSEASDGGAVMRVGTRVRHTRYGVGRVIAADAGHPPKVTVDFPGFGKKQIIATYLEPT